MYYQNVFSVMMFSRLLGAEKIPTAFTKSSQRFAQGAKKQA